MTTRLLLTTAASALALALGASPAAAQSQATPAVASEQRTPGPVAAPAPELPTTPSDNAMSNLVRLLAERGVITKEAGAALIQQAQAEAAQARVAQSQAQGGGELTPPAPGTIRVPYVPATVRNQIKDELRQEVLAQAKNEGWAAPEQAASEWTRNISIYGDVRLRSQSIFLPNTNSNNIFDFAEINANGPFDVLRTPAIPFLNTRVDRENDLRLRVRLGLDARLSKHVTAGLMLISGDDTFPNAANTVLGQGFGQRNIWLHRAYISVAPTDFLTVTGGRFDNPFWTTPIVFDEDIAVDGFFAQAQLGRFIGDGITLTLRGGAFPLDYGDFDNISTQQDKKEFARKFLFSGQIEAGAQFGGGVEVRAAAAYHDFDKLRGELSEPCLIYAGQVECSTDNMRPFYLRQGNTLSPLRQIALDPDLPPNTIQPQPQYFGLTFDYRLLDLSGSVSFPIGDKVRGILAGNFVKNLAFDEKDVCRNGVLGQPFNNGQEVDYNNDGIPDSAGSICATNNPSRFVGGDTAYTIYGTLGYQQPRRWGEWNVYGGYRYIESDASLDSFTDDNFHLGGTNAKGYYVGATAGLWEGLSIGGRWFSTSEITGERYDVDTLQIDLLANF